MAELPRSLRAPEIGQSGNPQLRPVASPVDTYARPSVPSNTGSGLLDLARSLSSYNPALARLGDDLAETHKRDMEVAAERTFGGLTLDQRNRMIAEGKLPELQDPVFRAAVDNLHGRAYALNEWRTATDQAINTDFDRNAGDINGFIAERVQAGMQMLDGRPNAQAAFVAATRGISSSWVSEQMAYADKAAKATRDDGVIAVFTQTVEDGVKGGAAPAAIMQAVRGQYQGNRELARLSPAEQDGLLFKALVGLATKPGYEGVIEHILRDKRDGVGAIADKAQFVGHADDLIRAARASTHQQSRENLSDARAALNAKVAEGEATTDEIDLAHAAKTITTEEMDQLKSRNLVNRRNKADAAAKALLVQAGKEYDTQQRDRVTMRMVDAADRGAASGLPPSFSYPKHDGTSAEVSYEQAKGDAIAWKLDWFDRQVAAGAKTPEQAEREKLRWFGANGWENPVWKRELAVTPHLDIANASANSMPPDIARRVALWKLIKAERPDSLDKYVPSTDDQRFYKLFTTMTEFQRMPETQALQATFRALQALSTPEGRAMADARRKDVRAAAGRVDFSDSGWWSRNAPGFLVWSAAGGNGTPKNVNDVQDQLVRLSETYALSGVAPEEALQLATKDFAATHIIVNGWASPLAGRTAPPDFQDQANYFLKRWTETRAADLEAVGVDPDRLTVRPMGSGTDEVWAIADADTGIPVGLPDAVFSMDVIHGQRAARIAKAEQEAARGATDSGRVAESVASELDRRRIVEERRTWWADFRASLTEKPKPFLKPWVDAVNNVVKHVPQDIEGKQLALKRRKALMLRVYGAMEADPEGAPKPGASVEEIEAYVRRITGAE